MPTPTTTAATGRLVEAVTADSLALAEAEAERLAEVERAAAAAREPDPTPRKRRTYDVWERRTLAALLETATADDIAWEDTYAWVRIATGVDKPTRDAAHTAVRNGRNGRFATILDGEFVEHVKDDPQAALAELIARDLLAHGSVADPDDLRAQIAESIANANAQEA